MILHCHKVEPEISYTAFADEFTIVPSITNVLLVDRSWPDGDDSAKSDSAYPHSHQGN